MLILEMLKCEGNMNLGMEKVTLYIDCICIDGFILRYVFKGTPMVESGFAWLPCSGTN